MPVSRRTLIVRVDRFLAVMERTRREPDEWEGQCLAQALADMAQGDLERAEQMMNLARTVHDQRPGAHPPEIAAPHPHPAVAELRARLQSLQADQLAA